MKRALLWAALLATLATSGCTVDSGSSGFSQRAAPGPSVPLSVGRAVEPAPRAVDAVQAEGGEEHAIGAPKTFDNLAVFTVTSKDQEDLGPITTLEAALAKHTASVHEQGQGREGSGAEVNSLVLENRGSEAVYVLAGTIVKGGKQDRQIGSDFIVGAHQTVPVDAYCVEHGRWTTNRGGVATGGQFGVVGVLADSRVRTAGQYQKNQSAVWSKVAAVNSANKQEAASGTLMATVDSSDIVSKRAALASKIDAYLASVQPNEPVVGLGYAVDGEVRSVRWFANHELFEAFRATLVNTAAMDAITARSEAVTAGRPLVAPAPLAPLTVSKFVKDIQASKVTEERSTPALNDISVRESKAGYGSTTSLKPASGSPGAKPKAVSSDFSSR